MESFKSEFVWPQELAYSAEPISTPNQFKIKSIRKQKPRAKPYEIEYDSTQTPHLWEFLVRLLEEQLYKEQANPAACYDAIIQWTDRNDYTFKLIDANQVASLWGQIKKRPTMNYDKMSRSLRYYYKEGVMQKIDKMRYTYKFLNTEEVNCFIVSYQRSLYPVNEHQTRKASKKSIGKVKCMESKSQQELEQLPLLSVNTNTPNSSFASTKTPKLVSNWFENVLNLLSFISKCLSFLVLASSLLLLNSRHPLPTTTARPFSETKTILAI